jgi:hypothetical protein
LGALKGAIDRDLDKGERSSFAFLVPTKLRFFEALALITISAPLVVLEGAIKHWWLIGCLVVIGLYFCFVVSRHVPRLQKSYREMREWQRSQRKDG